jgi:hypothetical protein
VSKGRGRRRSGAALACALVAVIAAAAAIPAAASASDDAIERKAALRASDFPAGWEKAARRDPTDSGLDACNGIDGVNAALVPISTRSPNFVRPDTDNVLANGSVVVLKSTKQARGYLEPYRDPEAVRCLETITETGLTDAGYTAVSVYVTPSTDVPAGADEAAGFNMQITVTSAVLSGRPDVTAVIYEDVVVVRVGRALASFSFLNPQRSLPDQDELVDVVIGRLEASL